MKKINRTDREAFVMDAILKQFELAKIPADVLKEDRKWYANYTISPDIHEQWKEWFLIEIRSRFKFTKKLALVEFKGFDLTYGLKVE